MPDIVAGSAVYSGTQANNASYTTNVAAGTGSNLAVLAILLRRTSTPRTPSMTYNGQAMTQVGNEAVNGNLRASVWMYKDAPTGTNSLSLSFSGGNEVQYVLMAAAFTGVDPTVGVNATVGATGTSNSAIGQVVTTTDNELIFGGMIHESAVASSTGANETTLFNNDNGAWCTSSSWAVKASAGGQWFDWPNTNSDIWAMAAASFFEAAEANSAPTISLGSPADTETVTTSTPTLTFTGSDDDDDDLTYEVEISTNPGFTLGPGDTLVETFDSGSGLKVHPNPSASPDQIDDRPGQSFYGNGGVLKQIELYIGDDTYTPSGTMYVRVYEHAGTYGTSSAPLNAADPADTPTGGWIAISDAVDDTAITTQTGEWISFAFSGSNQIRLEDDTPYIFILDWVPDTYTYDNTFALHGDSNNSGTLHAGNLYIDGASVANNGPQPAWDLWFRLTEEHDLIQDASDTDAGFSGTPDSTDPFAAGQAVTYTVQGGEALVDGATYYWRARVSDPTGTATWSDWSAVRSFDVSLATDIELSGSIQVVSSTPDNVQMSAERALGGIIPVASASDDTVALRVPRELSGLSAMLSSTTAAAALVARELTGSTQVVSSTPDNAQISVERSMGGIIPVVSTSDDMVALRVSRELSGGQPMTSATPDDAQLSVERALGGSIAIVALGDDTVALRVPRGLSGDSALESSAPDDILMAVSGETLLMGSIALISYAEDGARLSADRALSGAMHAQSGTQQAALSIVRTLVGSADLVFGAPDIRLVVAYTLLGTIALSSSSVDDTQLAVDRALTGQAGLVSFSGDTSLQMQRLLAGGAALVSSAPDNTNLVVALIDGLIRLYGVIGRGPTVQADGRAPLSTVSGEGPTIVATS